MGIPLSEEPVEVAEEPSTETTEEAVPEPADNAMSENAAEKVQPLSDDDIPF